MKVRNNRLYPYPVYSSSLNHNLSIYYASADSDITEYTSINAYYDNEDTSNFEKSIENNSNWILSNEVKSELKVLIPNCIFIGGNIIQKKIFNFFDIAFD